MGIGTSAPTYPLDISQDLEEIVNLHQNPLDVNGDPEAGTVGDKNSIDFSFNNDASVSEEVVLARIGSELVLATNGGDGEEGRVT